MGPVKLRHALQLTAACLQMLENKACLSSDMVKITIGGISANYTIGEVLDLADEALQSQKRIRTAVDG